MEGNQSVGVRVSALSAGKHDRCIGYPPPVIVPRSSRVDQMRQRSVLDPNWSSTTNTHIVFFSRKG